MKRNDLDLRHLPATQVLADAMYAAVGAAYSTELTLRVQRPAVRAEWLRLAVSWLKTQSPPDTCGAQVRKVAATMRADEDSIYQFAVKNARAEFPGK